MVILPAMQLSSNHDLVTNFPQESQIHRFDYNVILSVHNLKCLLECGRIPNANPLEKVKSIPDLKVCWQIRRDNTQALN